MGKHLLSKQSSIQFRDSNPGCMWSMFQFLDYHHWHYVKKMFPHKVHGERRHARYTRKTILDNQGTCQEFEDAEAEPFLVRQHGMKVSTNKRSVKTRIKEQQTKDKSKENSLLEEIDACNRKCKACDGMDYLSHNQGAGKHSLPLEKDNKKFKETNKFNRDISDEFKKYTDVLEIPEVKKELFLKILQDPDVGRDHIHGLQASNGRGRLMKSGSFPIARSSRMTNIPPCTLKHKQNEVWAFPKGQKVLPGNQTLASNFAKDNSDMRSLMPQSEDDDGAGSSMKQKGLNNRGWNQLVLHRFKVIKLKIKHALMEFRKDGEQTSSEASNHKVYSNCRISANGEKKFQSLDASSGEDYNNIRNSYDRKASDYDSNKHKLQSIRRTSSINESIDRYTLLFGKSFGEDNKWHTSKSKSLRLANEDKVHTNELVPKLSKRILSLPNLEYLCFSLYEASFDIYNSAIPGRTSVDCHTNAETDTCIQQNSTSPSSGTHGPLNAVVETEFQNNKVKMSDSKISCSSSETELIVAKHDEGISEISDLRKNINETVEGDFSRHHREVEEIGFSMHPEGDLAGRHQDAGLEISYQPDITSYSEGTELATGGCGMYELDPVIDIPTEGSTDSLPGPFCSKNSENVESTRKSHCSLLHFELNKKDDSDFEFVKGVLELSGFMGSEYLGAWHTVDQPLNPSLFKDYEAISPQEVECSRDEIECQCDHQLLFDLVNEVLIEIYDKSFTYFPNPFPFKRGIHPMPKGHHLLKQVWARISLYLSLRPELDQSLNGVVARDLAKFDSWMNLQYESECVALELEDMIFEELLDEAICPLG
ncbi:protein TRM32 [Quillaja saponaria]|uniref:Protein TRM32 n=1 Tax=Quillaja saponaria TaxID=32244 RepID=A0AAD7KXW1_QUISA|nr:protein TRM32 [Quillaja saponaria]